MLPDWLILLIPCVTGAVGALMFFLHTRIDFNKQKTLRGKFDGELSEEFSQLVDSVAEFQKVAHEFPNAEDFEAGQLVFRGDEVFLKTDDSYAKIGTESVSHSHLPTNCVNCGAPLHGHICKFCDTEYN